MIIFPSIQAKVASHHLTITVPKASPRYSLTVDIDPSPDSTDDTVYGKAVVKIISISTGKAIQSIAMPSVTLNKRMTARSVSAHDESQSPYGDTYSFVFQDFDFDGYQDLAICKDNSGSYGAPTYDIFRWNPSKKQFVKDPLLSKLSSEHLGLIVKDPKKPELIVFDKDGAAWHQSSHYAWRNNQLTLIKEEIDDMTGSKEVITTRTLVGNRWHSVVRRLPIKPEK